MDLVAVIKKIQLKKAEQRRMSNQAACLMCRQQTALLTIQQAINFYEVSVEEIARYVKTGAVHRIHNSKGEVLLCQNSLEKTVKTFQDTQPMRLEFLDSLGVG